VLITNGTLALGDPDNHILSDGALLIEDAQISAVGPRQELEARFPAAERLDAEGTLIMPGLVCAHAHAYRLLGRCFPLAGANLGPTPNLWLKLDVALQHEDTRYGGLLAAIEAVRAGTTTLLNLHSSPQAITFSLDALAEATLHVGLRAGHAYEVSDRHGPTAARQGVEENARFARRVRGEGLLVASMGLTTSSTLCDDTLATAVGAAALSDIGFHLPVAEDVSDEHDSLSRHGARVVERLRKRGVLGPRTVAAHCAQINSDEMEALGKARAWAVHTPRAGMAHLSGLAPVPMLLNRGVMVALGADSFPADLFAELQMGLLLHAHSTADARLLSAETMLRLALNHGGALATRLWRARLGELAAGALADIILVRPNCPMPLTRPHLPWHVATGGVLVDTVLVAGKVIMRHRRLTTVDEQAVYAHARELARGVWERM
jgi:putative selenium metabolism protein SsnA